MALPARKAQAVVRNISERKSEVDSQADEPRTPVRSAERAAKTAASKDDQLRLLKEMCAALMSAIEVVEQPSGIGFDSRFDFDEGVSFYEEVRRFESSLIRQALHHAGGRQTKAAALLGINHTTLHAMMKRYNIRTRSL